MPSKKAKDATPNLLLRRARIKRGWSQTDVAILLGVERNQISRWESIGTLPTHYYRQKLCEVFEMAAIDLGLTKQKRNSVPVDARLPVYDRAIPSPFARSDDFVGRIETVEQLEYLLYDDSSERVVLYGLPGVGKTTLTVEVINNIDVRAYFSDGILWADLGQEPNAQSIVSRWGKLLGMSDVEMKRLDTLEAWRNAVCNMIGERLMLIVLDDVWDIQVGTLFMIGGTHCKYLITTRFPEVAKHFSGENSVHLEELSEEGGVQLLSLLVPSIVKDKPMDARQLVQAVGGLPLALVLMGNYLLAQTWNKRPSSIRKALKKLYDVEGRLGLSMSSKDSFSYHTTFPERQTVSLKAVIKLGFDTLDPGSRCALRSLAYFPPKPNTFSKDAILSVVALSSEGFEYLLNSGLIENSGNERYTMHQTIADYIRLEQPDLTAAQRMVEYFVNYAMKNRSNYDALGQEGNNLYAAFGIASQFVENLSFVQGVRAIAPFLIVRGQYDFAERLLEQALQILNVLDSNTDKIAILQDLGRIAEKRGQYHPAEEYFQQGLYLAQQSNEQKLTCETLTALGDLAIKYQNYSRAEELFRQGLEIADKVGYPEQKGSLLANLGEVESYRGHLETAGQHLQDALTLIRQYQQHEQLCAVLSTLGMNAIRSGEYHEAEAYLQEGLVSARTIGHRELICNLLRNLGANMIYRGNYTLAEKYYQEGLALAYQIGHSELISSSLLNLGDLSMNRGAYKQAKVFLEDAYPLIAQLGNGDSYVRLITLGEIAIRSGNYIDAEKYLQGGMELALRIEDMEGVIVGLTNLCEVSIQQGNVSQAEEYMREGMHLATAFTHPWRVALLTHKAELAMDSGHYLQAEECLKEGFDLVSRMEMPERTCALLKIAGELAIRQTNFDKAAIVLKQGLDLARKIQNHWWVSSILTTYGNFYLEKELLKEAQEIFCEVQEMTQNISQVRFADALFGLARIAAKQANKENAVSQGRESLRIFKEISHRNVTKVEEWLSSLLQ